MSSSYDQGLLSDLLLKIIAKYGYLHVITTKCQGEMGSKTTKIDCFGDFLLGDPCLQSIPREKNENCTRIHAFLAGFQDIRAKQA